MAISPTVHVIDGDTSFCALVSSVARSVGVSVEAYVSAEEFLDRYTSIPNSPRCMVLAVRLPGLSGLGLQKMLAAAGKRIPVIVVSAYADISIAVQAVKAGAVDFLVKPLTQRLLVERIQEALDQDALRQREEFRCAGFLTRLDTLSRREREVMDLLVVGNHGKQIAAKFGIGEKTVAKHRSRVFEKLQIDSVAELVHLVLGANLRDHRLGHV